MKEKLLPEIWGWLFLVLAVSVIILVNDPSPHVTRGKIFGKIEYERTRTRDGDYYMVTNNKTPVFYILEDKTRGLIDTFIIDSSLTDYIFKLRQ